MAFRHRGHRHDTVAQARECESGASSLTPQPTPTTVPIHTPGCEGGEPCSWHSRCRKHRAEDYAASGNHRDLFRAYND